MSLLWAGKGCVAPHLRVIDHKLTVCVAWSSLFGTPGFGAENAFVSGIALAESGHDTLNKHLDVSALQRNVLFLEVSTLQRPQLHLDESALQRNVLFLEVSTLQRPQLHLDVSALQRSVLLLEVSATGPELSPKLLGF